MSSMPANCLIITSLVFRFQRAKIIQNLDFRQVCSCTIIQPNLSHGLVSFFQKGMEIRDFVLFCFSFLTCHSSLQEKCEAVTDIYVFLKL